MSKPMGIEKAKNFILVVLFLSTVLLLYFFWGNISFDGTRTPFVPVGQEEVEVTGLLSPAQVIASFGGGDYTVLPADEIWNNPSAMGSFVKELVRFGPSENVSVEEITEEQYRKVKSFRSIWAKFSYDIPLGDFCANINMKKPQSYDVIGAVTEIGYSTADQGASLYIRDGRNGKQYRLVSATSKDSRNTTGNTEFPALIDGIEGKAYNDYYPINILMGFDKIDQEPLVPYALETELKSLPYRQGSYSDQAEKLKAVSEQFFGSNSAFVREMVEENGTVVYMYGYGQNILIVNTDGTIEYKEEPSGNSGKQGFTASLEAAVSFAASHGSWAPPDRAGLTTYLKAVVPNPNKTEGYRFIFGLEVNGTPLYYEKGDPLVIDVTAGQVTYFKRNFIDVDQKDLEAVETMSGEDGEPAFSVVNLIAQNYMYIYETLLKTGGITAGEPAKVLEVEDIAALTNSMEIGYVRPGKEDSDELRPAWIVGFPNTEMYFDLYTAEPMGYSRD